MPSTRQCWWVTGSSSWRAVRRTFERCARSICPVHVTGKSSRARRSSTCGIRSGMTCSTNNEEKQHEYITGSTNNEEKEHEYSYRIQVRAEEIFFWRDGRARGNFVRCPH